MSVPVTSSGDVVAKVAAGAYTDKALNPNTESGTATVTVDATAPTVVIAKEPGLIEPTSTSPITLTVTFDEPVTGFDNGDVSVGGTAGGTKVANVTGGPAVYTVEVSGMTTTGTVVIDVGSGDS